MRCARAEARWHSGCGGDGEVAEVAGEGDEGREGTGWLILAPVAPAEVEGCLMVRRQPDGGDLDARFSRCRDDALPCGVANLDAREPAEDARGLTLVGEGDR